MLTYKNLWDLEPETRHIYCEAFFNGPYCEAFSDPNQMEGPDIWLPLMGDSAPEGKQQVWIIVALKSSPSEAVNVVGGIIFEKYRQCGDWLVTYLAVESTMRNKGVGKSLVSQAKTAIEENSAKSEYYVYAEAENPNLKTNKSDIQKAFDRWKILSALGMSRVEFNYVQPALSDGKDPLNDLVLLVWSPIFRYVSNTIPARRLVIFLEEFYKSLNCENSEVLARTISDLNSRSYIDVRPLFFPKA